MSVVELPDMTDGKRHTNWPQLKNQWRFIGVGIDVQ